MSQISAKYNAPTADSASEPVPGGQVIGYTNIAPDVSRVLDLSNGFRKAQLRKENSLNTFTVSLSSAVQDLKGLKDNGQEAPGFTTTKAIRRSAKLKFTSAADATKAHNYIVNMDADTLKDALKSETLESLLAQELGLEIADPKTMKNSPVKVALFPAHFCAS